MFHGGTICSGFEEVGEERQLKIYLNPTSGILNIVFERERAEAVTLGLYDLNGREVIKQIQRRAKGFFAETLDLALLPTGIYLLEINVGEVLLRARVIID